MAKIKSTSKRLGSGQRFAALKNKLSHQKGVTNPGALAAAIGRKKLGKAKFSALGKKGRRKVVKKVPHT